MVTSNEGFEALAAGVAERFEDRGITREDVLLPPPLLLASRARSDSGSFYRHHHHWGFL